MAQKGQIITNPRTGEYFEFVTMAAETGGLISTLKAMVRAGGFKPVEHIHLYQDEIFEVISGKLTFILDGHKGTIGPGGKIALPRGISHTHYNAEKDDLVMYQSLGPSLDFEPFAESLAYLVNEGKVPNGQPPFLQLMIWMKEMEGTTCVANLPVGMQKFLAAVLAPAGRALGYKKFYTGDY